MVETAADYRLSSAVAHCHGGDDPLLDSRTTVAATISNWAAWLACPNDEAINQHIRDCTFTGRPCGRDTFVKQMEASTHRDFTRKKPGPKPKAREEDSPLLDWPEDRIVR